MNLRTFGQIKGEIARVCGTTGMPVTDPRVMQNTNLAVEEILNEGDFPWTVGRIIFRVYEGRVVLPTSFDRIISMSVDGIPQQINSPWYETTSFRSYWGDADFWPNTGEINGWYNSGFTVDRDEVFQFRDIPLDQYYFIEVKAQLPEDEGAELYIKGYDPLKSPVTTNDNGTWIEGEKIPITQEGARSTVPFSQFYGVVKPVTKGEVYAYAVGAADGSRIHVGTYAPQDTTPFYRSYKVVGTPLCGCSCVLARCRRRYHPVTSDNDFVMCGNIPALKKMVQAVWFGDAGDVEKYAAYKTMAVDILKKEATAYRGKSRVPAITFQRGYGLGVMPYLR